MDRLKAALAALDIVADRVDDRVGTLHRRRHRRFVPDVGVSRHNLTVGASATEPRDALRMPYCDADECAGIKEALDDPASQETRSSEDGNAAAGHVRLHQ
jgi:hypothetical protein